MATRLPESELHDFPLPLHNVPVIDFSEDTAAAISLLEAGRPAILRNSGITAAALRWRPEYIAASFPPDMCVNVKTHTSRFFTYFNEERNLGKYPFTAPFAEQDMTMAAALPLLSGRTGAWTYINQVLILYSMLGCRSHIPIDFDYASRGSNAEGFRIVQLDASWPNQQLAGHRIPVCKRPVCQHAGCGLYLSLRRARQHVCAGQDDC